MNGGEKEQRKAKEKGIWSRWDFFTCLGRSGYGAFRHFRSARLRRASGFWKRGQPQLDGAPDEFPSSREPVLRGDFRRGRD